MMTTNEASSSTEASTSAQAAVFAPSTSLPEGTVKIKGPDFDQPQDLDGLMAAFGSIGFQATGVSRAIEIIDKMVSTSPKERERERLKANEGRQEKKESSQRTSNITRMGSKSIAHSVLFYQRRETR